MSSKRNGMGVVRAEQKLTLVSLRKREYNYTVIRVAGGGAGLEAGADGGKPGHGRGRRRLGSAQRGEERHRLAAGHGRLLLRPTPAQVRVELSGTYSLAFAKLVGIGSATLHATSTSDPIPSG